MLFQNRLLLKLLFLFLGSSFFVLQAQNDFDPEVISNQLEEQLNQQRLGLNLKPLEPSEVLDAIAFDQAEYLMESARIVHTQDNAKKKTLLDRILYYKAYHAEAGENIMMVSQNGKLPIEQKDKRVVIDTEAKIISAALFSWNDDEETALNINDPTFSHYGFAAVQKENKDWVLVLVTASPPYELLQDKKMFEFSDIKPYSDEACKKFAETYSALPQLLSDAFIVKKNQVYFDYHSPTFTKQLLENGSDGISAEIICKSQYECQEGNRLFPGTQTNGYLLPFLKRSKLLYSKEMDTLDKIEVSIGEVPSFYSEEKCEVNGIFIKDGAKCFTIPHNKIAANNIKQLKIEWQLAGDSLNYEKWYSDTTTFIYSKFESSSSAYQLFLDDYQKLNQFLTYDSSTIHMEMNFSLSPADEYDSLELIHFAETFKKSLSFIPDSSGITFNVNWDAYHQFAANTLYQLDTRGMSKDSIQDYLMLKRKDDAYLSNFLDSIKILKVELSGKYQIRKTDQIEEQYRFLLNSDKNEAALSIQKKLLEEGKSVASTTTAQIKEKLGFLNNEIVSKSIDEETQYDGNLIHTAFLELYLIDPTQAEVSFNYHLALLKYWSQSYEHIKNAEEWLAGFKKVNPASLEEGLHAKVLLNYYIILADYYYEKAQFEKRKKAFTEIFKLQAKANLDLNEVLQLAQYLSFQDQYEEAKAIIEQRLNQQIYTAELLFYYLQLGIYYEIEDDYYDKLELAQEKYPDDFCKFFNSNTRGFQAFEDLAIKKLYCENCLEKE